MIVQTVVITPFVQNCRILVNPGDRLACVIDPGGELPRITGAIRQLEARVENIFLTHAHIDHAGAVAPLLEWLQRAGQKPKLFAHRIESEFRKSIERQALLFGVSPKEYQNAPEPDRYIEDGDVVSLAGRNFRALFTPGHSPGHLALFAEGGVETELLQGSSRGERTNDPLLFAGDTLFAGSIGRTDLPGGDHETLLRCIREKLLTLPDSTRVLSGHGPDTTIGAERASNPFLNGRY